MVEQDEAEKAGLEALTSSASDPKKSVTMTKSEQDKLLAKMKAFAKKEDVSAQNLDFSKPIDQQEDDGDITKEQL